MNVTIKMNNMKNNTIIKTPAKIVDLYNDTRHGRNDAQMQAMQKLLFYQYKSITISGKDFIRIVPISTIMLIQSSSNYSTIVLNSGKKILTCKTLKFWKEKIDDPHFIRCHNSYLINKNYVKSINRIENHLFVNDMAIPIARSKKNNILKYFL